MKRAAVLSMSTLQLGKLYPYREHLMSGAVYYQMLRGDPEKADPFVNERYAVTLKIPEDPAVDPAC